MSMTDLSKRTGKSVSYLRRIERGERRGLPATLRLIEAALNLEPLILSMDDAKADQE